MRPGMRNRGSRLRAALLGTLPALLALLIGGVAPPAQAAEEGEPPSFEQQFAQQLDEWLPGLGAEKIQDRSSARQALQKVCFEVGAPGREADRAVVCRVMAQKLAEANAPAKARMLRELQFIGREECIEAVAALLDDNDEHVRDAARRCLEHNPEPGANAKLLAALPKSSGRFRVGIINSLGTRGDPASVSALVGLLGERDAEVAGAAATALGKLGGAEATAALQGALGRTSAETRNLVANALLGCAEKLLAAGKKTDALAVYQKLDQADMPQFIRVAAVQGKLRAAGARP